MTRKRYIFPTRTGLPAGHGRHNTPKQIDPKSQTALTDYPAMISQNNASLGIPSRSRILSYLLTDLLDLGYDGMDQPEGPFDGKSKEARRKWTQRWHEKTLTSENMERLERAVMDAILQVDGAWRGSSPESNQTDRDVFWKNYSMLASDRTAPGSPFDQVYPEKLDTVELAVQLQDFLKWNEEFAKRLGADFTGESVQFAWKTSFVLPWFAVQFSAMQQNFPDWDSGMPAGLHWYLPQPGFHSDGRLGFHMPCAQVLEWWEDLFDKPLRSYDALTKDGCKKLDPASDDLHGWKHGERAMSWDKIMEWTKDEINWQKYYAAPFNPDAAADFSARWNSVHAFLMRKWQAWDTTRQLSTQDYSGKEERERFGMWLGFQLGNQLHPSVSWVHFHDAKRGLTQPSCWTGKSWQGTMDEMMDRVAKRWRKPSNLEVRRRLIIASAIQRLFSSYLGNDEANPAQKESSIGYGAHQAVYAIRAFIELSSGATAAMDASAHLLGSHIGKRRWTARWIQENYKGPDHLKNSLLGAFDPDEGIRFFYDALLATKANAAPLDEECTA